MSWGDPGPRPRPQRGEEGRTANSGRGAERRTCCVPGPSAVGPGGCAVWLRQRAPRTFEATAGHHLDVCSCSKSSWQSRVRFVGLCHSNLICVIAWLCRRLIRRMSRALKTPQIWVLPLHCSSTVTLDGSKAGG